jgi:hypothetical protein
MSLGQPSSSSSTFSFPTPGASLAFYTRLNNSTTSSPFILQYTQHALHQPPLLPSPRCVHRQRGSGLRSEGKFHQIPLGINVYLLSPIAF